ncbi:cytochrome P450 [Diplogelasinospora grovesii]|uniref:Cytochrome P450 n=1 Tax=Diplogelasinospora grovesii TaxID=303347 RepID=A0AAN6S887_9PEZI|nr:cytochrome P450 [Diplogelasinospora grovesii]
MIVSPPRINLRRAASHNPHDRGPLSSTSSRFNFNHLVFSPPPSPGLPSLSPPLRKPWSAQPHDQYEMVAQDDVPDFPTPIVVTDRRGRAKWTVSIQPDSNFPLTPGQYSDLCAKCKEVSGRVRELRTQSHGLQQAYLSFTSSDSGDHDFIDIQEAENAVYLLSAKGRKSGKQGQEVALVGTLKTKETADQPICAKSMTFVLESTDAGIGRTLMMLWTAYGLALRENRAFFIDDTRWAYGKYTEIFKAPPVPACRPPPRHEMLPCPRQARHLIASAATASEVFDRYMTGSSDADDRSVQKTMFSLARQGYEALFELNKDDGEYVDGRIRELMAKRMMVVSPKTTKGGGGGAGLTVGVHVRRGDCHPFEYQYRDSYVPLNNYADTARDIINDRLNTRAHSFVVLASDDPMVYESDEFADASRAQERIKLANKQAIQQAQPARNVMRKYVDETFGWEGGFFAAMFWNLGVSSTSAAKALPSGSSARAYATAAAQPSSETIRLRSLVGRAYMMDLAVLAGASDVVVCTVSAVGCRLLAVMMGWDSAMQRGNWVNIDGGLQFSQLGTASQIGVAIAAFFTITVVLNVLQQVLFKNPNEPPLVFHWFPVIGSTITYGMDPPRFFKENREKYGECFTFILLGKKTTVYVGTQGNEFILNGKIRDVCAEEIYTVLTTPVFGKDVVYDCPNSKLMEQKKFMKVALTTEAFRQYVPIISDEVLSYFKRSPDFKGKSGTVNISPKMAQITIFTASHALQGKEIRDQFDESLADLYHDLDMGFSPVNFMLHWAPLPWNKRRDHAQRTVAKIYMDTIKRRRERGETGAQDIMWHLMNSEYKGGVKVPDHEIAHMMIALLMAGQHSSSSTSSWIMLRLASRPDIMEELYQEQVDALGADLPELTYEDLAKLPLNQAIVKETLRLHAPIHSIMRAVKQPMPVPGTKLVIPTSHVLLAAPGVSATDPHYFPNPELWDPHRWEKDSPNAPAISRSTAEDEDMIDYGYGLVSKGASSPYLPFGAGRHRCIGEQFANVQLQTIVAMTVRLFKFRNVDGSNKVIGTDYASLFSRPLEPAVIAWERRDSN